MADVAMPRLSDSMEEGTILKWLKSDGDEVSEGDELVEIETDKANMTYEADESGTLEIVAKEGDTLAVGETIAKIGEGGGGSSDEEEDGRGGAGGGRGVRRGRGARRGRRRARTRTPKRTRSREDDEEEPTRTRADEDEDADEDDEEADDEDEADEDDPARRTTPAADEARRDPATNGRVKASPIARRMARDLGLELSDVKGTGPGGRIVKADVEAAAKGDGEPRPRGAEGGGKPEKDEGKPAKDGESGRGEVEHQELAGCSARSRAGWPSPRRPRRTS